MNTGLLDCLLNTQSKTAIPAGQKMQVVMIDRGQLHRNPDNRIYIIGDVSRLKEDIRANGIRQPLEVVELSFGGYKLIGGERRLTACEELAKEGMEGFDMLPCVIRESKDADDDKIALITANATARDLTDGERLAQYEALKEVLTRKKSFGQLKGKVRDELCRILGLSTGAAARLNAIAENCDENIKHQLRNGEISLMGAYRRAQEIITARMAQQEAAKAPKPDKLVYEKPVVFDCPPKAAETIPQNPDYDEWNLPPECRVAVEKAHREVEQSALDSLIHTLPSMHSTDPSSIRKAEQKQEEQQRGKKTLRLLAEKTLKEDAPWELAWEDVQFGLEYYKQPLPGGAKLWKRVDETRREAGQTCNDYAIILQDNKFYTCGWISFYSGITDLLTKYFELK
nr:MAG TPA: chromosome partitioning protein [Caudoviricetes sp.]